MGQARHHCEQAFEAHLRRRRAPLVSVNESRKSLLPARLQGGRGAPLAPLSAAPDGHPDAAETPGQLKSFDYILYGADVNLLVEIKGRRLPARGETMQNWVTAGDIDSLLRWQTLFGPGFCAAIVFMYWSDQPPPHDSNRPEEIFEHRGRWYMLRVITAADYHRHMRPRSPRWETMHLAAADFDRLSRPLLGPRHAAVPPRAPAPLIRRPTLCTSRIPPIAPVAGAA